MSNLSYHQKPTTFVRHVHLNVANLERSITFYQEVIGFQVLDQSATTARLTADGKTPLLTIEQPADVMPKQGRTTGLYHFAILLPTRGALASIVEHFMAKGVRVGSADHLVSEALYLDDVDGNGIEIYVDRPGAAWSWQDGQVAMTVDPLDFRDLLTREQPIEPWRGLPSGTIMGHIHLHVADLGAAEHFYGGQGLGFDVVCRYGSQALFISDGNYHHHIGLNTWQGVGAPAPAANSVGMKAYTIVYADEAKRAEVTTRLANMGVETTALPSGAVYVQDPSGNGIELVV